MRSLIARSLAGTMFAGRCVTVAAAAAAGWLVWPGTALAQEEGFLGGDAGGKAYVNQYFLVALCLAAVLWTMCRPSRRALEVRIDRELAEADKSGANV